MSLAQLISDVWEQELRETPDPFDDTSGMLNALFGLPRLTYRERLDKQHRNSFGELIPRIATVRRNLRSLAEPPHPPRLPE